MDAAYDAGYYLPVSFIFNPATGPAFGSAQIQVQEYTPPDHKVDKATFTPISGANSGNEQFALGKTPVQTIMIKATYSSTEHAAAQACLAAKVTGTLTGTYGLGPLETVAATDAYPKAALTGIKPSTINADGLRTDELEFTVALPSTFTAGH